MAAPAQSLLNCEQKTADSADLQSPAGGGGLKNGASEDLGSDEIPGNVMVNNRVKSPSSASGHIGRELTMDNFQDGGTHQLNARPSGVAGDQGGFLDRQRINSDFRGFNQNPRDSVMVSDEFRNSQDALNHVPVGSYSTGYSERGSYLASQHGGQSIPGNASDPNSPQHKLYPHYNQQQMRPGYPQSPRPMGPMGAPQRPGSSPMMSCYPPNANGSAQQRFLSGPSISQQGGPTPTLNQLLQSPNPLQRYQNNYGDFAANQGMHKGMTSGDMSQAPQYPSSGSSHGWGAVRGSSPYPQQITAPMYRPPVGPLHDPTVKRPYMTTGQQTPPGATSQSQYVPQQYPQRPYTSQQPRPMNQGYSQMAQYQLQQQQLQPQPSPQPQSQPPQQQSLPQQSSQSQPLQPPPQQASPQQPPQQPQQTQQQPPQTQQTQQTQPPPQQPQPPPPSQQPQQPPQTQQQPTPQQPPPPPASQPQQLPPSSQQQQAAVQQQQPPHTPPHPSRQGTPNSHVSGYDPRAQMPAYTQSQNQASQQDLNTGLDDVSADPHTSTSGRGTPGLRPPGTPPTSQATGGQGPSTPHPVVSPLRPVPSPSGSSSGSRSMSPAIGTQSNIPMPPRPSSSQSDSSASNHLNQPQMTQQVSGYNPQIQASSMYGPKMHSGIMPSYPPQSAHYSQNNYPRQQGTLSMQPYGASSQPPSSYPGPGPVSGGPGGPGGPGSYPSHAVAMARMGSPAGYSTSNSNYMNSQFSSFGVNSMMPPPSQYPKPPGSLAGAVQTAAQIAAIAAGCSTPGNMRPAPMHPSPMQLRHHLQQKIYGYTSPMTPPGPSEAAIPPSQSPGMSQSSPHPPTASTPAPPGESLVACSSNTCYTQSTSAMGTPVTMMTQSVSSPVSSSTISSANLSSSGDIPTSQGTPLQGGRGNVPLQPPPPPVIDEGSQASNASASSSLPEEHSDTSKPNSKPPMSHPPTPNTLPSPGGASMSSFHDEFENVSSPSWPRTPASPVVNSQVYEHHMIKRPDGLLKLYDMSDDPDRRMFLDKLIMYSDERGTPITQCPTISKQPLDLFRLYLIVKDRGGFVEVTKAKHWKDVAGVLGIGASSSAAYTLRKQYIKHLLPFECKYDRGGIDPQPIINSVEAASRKKNKGTMSPSGTGQEYGQVNQPIDGYPSSYPGAYPPGGPPGMMPNADYPCPPGGYSQGVPNHVGPGSDVGMPDAYGEDVGQSQYPHTQPDQYSYPQTAVVPPYSATQSSMSGGSCGYSSAGPVQQPDQYGGDQYPSHPQMVPQPAEGSFNNRPMVPDPYSGASSVVAPPPPPQSASSVAAGSAGYSQARNMGQGTTPQYQYQGHYDRERFDQQQGAMVRPPSQPGPGSVMGPPSQGDHSMYPGQCYSGQPQTSAGNYQNRPPVSQYPSGQTAAQTPYQQAQQDSYRNPDYQMGRVQSPLAQRLLPKTTPQMYSGNQSTMYSQTGPPSSKVGPPSGPNVQRDIYQRDMYPGPKRHPDFMKPQDQYHMGSYGQQPAQQQQPQPQQQQTPPAPPPPPPPPSQYGDRNQYPYRPPHMMTPPATSMQQQGWNRDSQYRQYAGPTSQGQYPPSHPTPDRWDALRPGETAPTSMNSWSVSRGPQGEPYPPHMGSQSMSMGHKMPPYPANRGYVPQSKMPAPAGVGPTQQYGQPPHPRKEIIFPPDSVEAVLPVMVKRRRLFAKDVSPVEAWRLMMSLKSGLLAESTWALDVLSVLLYDDSTVLYFGLSHLPGLLETLIEHYRRCLAVMFGITDDLELGYDVKLLQEEDLGVDKEEPVEKPWYSIDKDVSSRDLLEELIVPMSVNKEEKTEVLSGENFTLKTRCGKSVRTRTEDSLYVMDPEKKWDLFEGFSSCPDHWQLGGGEITSHIQTCFESDQNNVRFVRILKDVKKEVKEEETEDEADDETLDKDDKDSDSDESLKKSSDDSIEKKFHLNCRKEPIVLVEDIRYSKIKIECEALKQEETKTSSDKGNNSDVEEKEASSDKETSNKDEKEVNNDQEESDKMDAQTEKEDIAYPRIRLAPSNRKRTRLEDFEEEAYTRDEPSLCVLTDKQDSISKRCICISNILRNLSFVPGNDSEMSKHAGFLLLLGRLLLLHHCHGPRKPPRHYDREDEAGLEQCSSLCAEKEWWWESLQSLRENTLVCLANMAGQLDLAPYPEEISLPILDGLLHWAVCPAACARDPLPTLASHSVLTPQRLALEALCKLSVQDSNVDLMLATPPWSRTDRLFGQLSRWLARGEDQVLREFSVVLLSNLATADSSSARAIAMQGSCVSHLIAFVEQAEQSALQVANNQGINALRENPELMGTTLDMVRRAAGTLRCLARVPDNRPLFIQHQQRLLALVMSQILDQGVAAIIADVLFECSQVTATSVIKPTGQSSVS